MTSSRRPRVAVIGLNRPQVESISPLCGDLRSAESVKDYRERYSWTETDVVVASNLRAATVASGVSLMSIGTASFGWSDSFDVANLSFSHSAKTSVNNTERELATSAGCPDLYRPLAAELARLLGRATDPPSAIETTRSDQNALVETTSGRPVAMRLVLPTRSEEADNEASTPIALLLPAVADLAAWFRAFLFDLHESDPTRVPHAPPRLSQPADWFTPEEKDLADQILQINSEIERLTKERIQRETKLAAQGERADQGIRQILWADGDELVAAAGKVFSDLGFKVRDMDAELADGEPKREDLRLTLASEPGWQAMVEVKGYTSGTRTNDRRQIREHRERYIAEERRPPDLTVWLANPHRRMDPSSRPAPDQNVNGVADAVGAVHVLATDLYRQWALVAMGSLQAETVVQSLIKADPGLWTPPETGSGT